jgi:hypothetical protein
VDSAGEWYGLLLDQCVNKGVNRNERYSGDVI